MEVILEGKGSYIRGFCQLYGSYIRGLNSCSGSYIRGEIILHKEAMLEGFNKKWKLY
jgi:hypothetical protein